MPCASGLPSDARGRIHSLRAAPLAVGTSSSIEMLRISFSPDGNTLQPWSLVFDFTGIAAALMRRRKTAFAEHMTRASVMGTRQLFHIARGKFRTPSGASEHPHRFDVKLPDFQARWWSGGGPCPHHAVV